MKWLLVLLSDGEVVDKSPQIHHESEDQAKMDLLEQFDYLFNEYLEDTDEDSESNIDDELL